MNGSDYFQVFLDHHHRKYGRIGNVSRLALTLNALPNIELLEKKLRANPYVSWMSSLRLKTSFFFQLPRWKTVEDKVSITLHYEVSVDVTSCERLFDRDINCRKESPIQFDVVPLVDQWAFVLSWNHILMDARGAEILLSQIEMDNDITFFAKDNFLKISWKERLKEIKAVKNFLVPRVEHGVQLITTNKKREKNVYRILKLSADETSIMDDKAEEYKIGIAKSTFYLSAIQQAFINVVGDKKVPSWVPVPQDQRRKGQLGPVMSNQVSFLFYSLKESECNLQQGIPLLRNQMMDQMRSRLPNSYRIMMDSMLRFPRWLYHHLVASPTNGALASYFFSDTGESLNDLISFAKCKVNGAMHYPPNCSYPGLTIIFMRYKGNQQIIFSFPEGNELQPKMDMFERELKNNLFGFEKA